MHAKKEAAVKEVVDSRANFLEKGVKASDVFYTNQDRILGRRAELRGTGKNEATTLKGAYEMAQEEKYNKMKEEA